MYCTVKSNDNGKLVSTAIITSMRLPKKGFAFCFDFENGVIIIPDPEDLKLSKYNAEFVIKRFGELFLKQADVKGDVRIVKDLKYTFIEEKDIDFSMVKDYLAV